MCIHYTGMQCISIVHCIVYIIYYLSFDAWITDNVSTVS